jgi:uncharacterized protein (TIGR03437 family)
MSFGATPNIFRGVVAGNQVTFNGVPVLAPVTGDFSRVFRITNVRANVGVPTGPEPHPVQVSLSVTGPAAFPVDVQTQIAAFIEPGLAPSVRNAANSGALTSGSDSLAFPQCTSTNGPVNGATLRFTETFATAFKTRLASMVTSTGIGPIDNNYIQNTPGVNYVSESGLVLAAGGGTAGLADFGTRLRATFNNVPPGVRVFVTTTNYAAANGLAAVADPAGGSPTFLASALGNGRVAPAIAQLVQDETTPDDHGQVPAVAGTIALGPSATPTSLAEVTLANGRGEAVWEVIQANQFSAESLDFGVYFQYAGGTPPVGTGTVSLSYAPTPSALTGADVFQASATQPIPRFVDSGTATDVVSIGACPATHFTVTASPTASADTPVSVGVIALDAANNTVTTYSGTVHFTSTDPLAALPPNSHLTSGIGSFAAGLSTPGNQTISVLDVAAPSITGTSGTIAVSAAVPITLSLAPTNVTYGASQTVTATVTSGGVPATSGTVTFVDAGTGTTLASNVPVSNGVASATAVLSAGLHSIVATYNPDATHTVPSGAIFGTVNKAVLTVTAQNATKVAGAPLPQLTALLTGFVNGDTIAAVTGTPSVTTSATAASPAGNYPIAAAAGTLAAANYTFTFVNGTLVVTAQPTLNENTGGSTPATGFFGQSFTTPSSGPWFNVTFNFFSDQGQTPVALGTAYLFISPYTGSPADLNGQAVTAQSLRARPHARPQGFVAASTGVVNGAYVFPPSVVLQPNTTYYIYEDTVVPGVMTGAVVDGANDFVASSPGSPFTPSAVSTNFRLGGTTVPPSPPQTVVDLTSSLNPSTAGQPVTFTALVSADNGTVTFLDGTTTLSTVTLSGGRATYTTSALAAGTHTIAATYSGGVQATMVQTVTALESTISLAASPANAAAGQAITLTATVGPATAPAGYAPPSGQVTFSMEGGSILAPPVVLGSVALASGKAVWNLASLPVGTHYLTASYRGDGIWAARSSQITFTVSPATTTTTVSLAMISGQLTLTGIVTGAGTPTGTVEFRNGSTVIASAVLSGGKASSAVTSSAMGRPIVAVYSGDAGFQPSTSTPLPVLTNAAWSSDSSFAADEIASVFRVSGLRGDTSATLPLTASLGGATVTLTDSAGASRPTMLYGVFASAGQINLLLPGGLASGPATVTIAVPDGPTASTVIDIANTAPGIFTTTMDGKGGYAGQVFYLHRDGTQSAVTAGADPIDLGANGDQVYLVLYGSGLRHAGTVSVTLNGTNLPVLFFGPQGAYPGLDQINVGPLPASLAGASLANLVVRADGQPANAVTVRLQ